MKEDKNIDFQTSQNYKSLPRPLPLGILCDRTRTRRDLPMHDLVTDSAAL